MRLLGPPSQEHLPIGGTGWGIAAGDHVVWVAQPNFEGAMQNPPQTGSATRINF